MTDEEIEEMEGRIRPAIQEHDRCDRCGAQAFVRIILVNGEFYLCGHHYAENEKAILARGYVVRDERDHLEGGNF